MWHDALIQTSMTMSIRSSDGLAWHYGTVPPNEGVTGWAATGPPSGVRPLQSPRLGRWSPASQARIELSPLVDRPSTGPCNALPDGAGHNTSSGREDWGWMSHRVRDPLRLSARTRHGSARRAGLTASGPTVAANDLARIWHAS